LAKLSLDSQAVPHYTLHNGVIKYKGKIVLGDNSSLKTEIVANFHKSALGGYSGERATLKRIQLIFHWPKMQQYVKDYVSTCPVCQKNKAEHIPYAGLLAPLPILASAWTHVSMDFIEGLPTSGGM
jgi:hypothetical protein